MTGDRARRRAAGPEPAGVGRVRADGARLAHHLVGQLGDAPVGLPQLRDRRQQPQQLVGRPASATARAGTTTTTPNRGRPPHGHKWWEFDVTYLTIRLLEAVGLATNVVRPKAWSKVKP